MSKSFLEGVKTPFANAVQKYLVTTKEGPKTFTYLPWALALALADTPAQTVENRERGYFAPVFGGAVVGVTETLADGQPQTTWLPVLNGAHQPIPEARITSRDVSDTVNRCRAKAVAMTQGVALSLYVPPDEDTPAAIQRQCNTLAFIKTLGVKPDTDLSRVQPIISMSEKKNGVFIDWPHALAAARITDPNFRWEVPCYEVVDRDSGEVTQRPYFRLGSGWGVSVRVFYKSVEHEEILPIMGFVEVETKRGIKLLDHQPLLNPNAHDWNRSVMRCLVKAIAIASGYGLNVYAKSDVRGLHVEPAHRATPSNEAAPAPATAPPAPSDDPEQKRALVGQVTQALVAAHRGPKEVLDWLGHKDARSLEDASVVELQRALAALTPPPSAAVQQAASA